MPIVPEDLEPLTQLLANEGDEHRRFAPTKYRQLAKDIAAKDVAVLRALPDATQRQFLEVRKIATQTETQTKT